MEENQSHGKIKIGERSPKASEEAMLHRHRRKSAEILAVQQENMSHTNRQKTQPTDTPVECVCMTRNNREWDLASWPKQNAGWK